MRDSSGRSLSSAVLSSLHSHPKNAGHEATVRTDETMAMTLGPQELRGGGRWWRYWFPGNLGGMNAVDGRNPAPI